jgi:uncharacterized protein (TIGR02145 family)
MKKLILFALFIFYYSICIFPQDTPGTLIDIRDGKVYKTVKIGNQWWMAENLNYDIEIGSWAYNNDTTNLSFYGRLYNWKTACSVCPKGWHLPSNKEWDKITDFLGGWEIAGAKMKKIGTDPRTHTNESGFSSVPGGYRSMFGIFNDKDEEGYFWSSTEIFKGYAWYRSLHYNVQLIGKSIINVEYGYSIRCIKD